MYGHSNLPDDVATSVPLLSGAILLLLSVLPRPLLLVLTPLVLP
jgi:hypothetical protein